ncbi:hypothetical protein KGF54_002718 [Candida jiufengensis]|uniref:uncharacterized protein n=1 Tax=Candida jiufengensis TaxID=497108 RepID=UPI0022252374|nr:uncharacterized protein KGF54_002718 [Candida jiufengensis]KAI5953347.1 hypothetical protein KGF54_002718 [Candida jiufengensis]
MSSINNNNNNNNNNEELNGEEEGWNDLSSPDLTTNTNIDTSQNIIRSRLNQASTTTTTEEEEEDIQDISRSSTDQSLNSSNTKTPQWQKCTLKILVLIGYTITTILFSIITYLHYFFIRYSYDEETAINILDGVFRAQEKAINNYHKRHNNDQRLNSIEIPPSYQ